MLPGVVVVVVGERLKCLPRGETQGRRVGTRILFCRWRALHRPAPCTPTASTAALHPACCQAISEQSGARARECDCCDGSTRQGRCQGKVGPVRTGQDRTRASEQAGLFTSGRHSRRAPFHGLMCGGSTAPQGTERALHSACCLMATELLFPSCHFTWTGAASRKGSQTRNARV